VESDYGVPLSKSGMALNFKSRASAHPFPCSLPLHPSLIRWATEG
jgi:hypothetical protein